MCKNLKEIEVLFLFFVSFRKKLKRGLLGFMTKLEVKILKGIKFQRGRGPSTFRFWSMNFFLKKKSPTTFLKYEEDFRKWGSGILKNGVQNKHMRLV